MIRIAGTVLMLVSAGGANAQSRMSDYVRGINEERCFKQDVSACGELINAGFGVPAATRARALAIRGEARLRNDAIDGARADLNGALEITEASQDEAMAKLDAARGVSGVTAGWRSSVHAKLAEALLRGNDRPGAGAEIDKAIALDASNAFAYSVRARLAGSQEQWTTSLADFDTALRIGMKDPAERAFTYYRRGLVRAMLKQPVETQVADLTSAIGADPTLAMPYERRGGLYQDLGRHEEALRDYDMLTTHAPKYAAGFNAACWTRAAYLKREFEKARAQCAQALALAPEPNTHDSAGLAALQLGQWQEAWAHYDKAVKGDAKMASARYGRGIAAKRLGRAAEAEADFAAAGSMDAQVARNFASYGQRP